MAVLTTTITMYSCDRCGRKTELVESGGMTSVDSWRRLSVVNQPALDLCDTCVEDFQALMVGKAVSRLSDRDKQ